MGGAVTSAGKGRCAFSMSSSMNLHNQEAKNETVVQSTYKKNLGLPLTTALSRASLSVGFLGMGLQKAKGSQQASCSVRYR
jgi:hypothetical protein